MREVYRKIISLMVICIILAAGSWAVSQTGWHSTQAEFSTEEDGNTQTTDDKAVREAYEQTDPELVLWYEDASYTPFFQLAAEQYFARTGVKVAVECQSTLDYMGEIYDRTIEDDAFPDVYLISGENLEEMYLYGLVSENVEGLADTGAALNAVAASTYEGRQMGYPLSFHTCVFIFQSGYFGEAPASLQSIVDYSIENEPPENVEYLLEWNVNDAYYDFPFIANSVTFEKTGIGVMQVLYNEELYQQDLEYFETILGAFSIDTEKVSEQGIVDNFLAGRTLSAIIDTDFLWQLEEYDYALMRIPDLSETLAANTCAGTDMLVVNDFSRREELAADFARFATVEMAAELYPSTGHFSVIPSAQPNWVEQTAFDAYANAVLLPDSQDAKSFWVNLEETFLKYF